MLEDAREMDGSKSNYGEFAINKISFHGKIDTVIKIH